MKMRTRELQRKEKTISSGFHYFNNTKLAKNGIKGCKMCGIIKFTDEFYTSSHHFCILCSRIRARKKHTCVQKKLRHRRSVLIKIFDQECKDCGLISSIDSIYDFHHTDPATMSFRLTVKNMSKSWEDILKEAMKCVLLCSNCHRVRHYNLSRLKWLIRYGIQY